MPIDNHTNSAQTSYKPDAEMTRMMEQIWEEHHSPDKKIKLKYLKNREVYGKDYI